MDKKSLSIGVIFGALFVAIMLIICSQFKQGILIEKTADSGQLGGTVLVGSRTITRDLTVQGNAAVTGTLTQTGNVTMSGDATVTGNATVTGTLTQTGAATFATDASITQGDLTINDGVINFGGRLATSTTASTVSLTPAEVCTYGKIVVTQGPNLTLNIPAAADLVADCFGNDGDWRRLVIENASTSGTITIGAGTGIDLQEPDGQNIVINGLGRAYLDFDRESATDIDVRVDETIAAD